MELNTTRPRAHLDVLRAQNGTEGFRTQFERLCKTDANRAIQLLSDERLGFPTLFYLREEVSAHGLGARLRGRAFLALGITEQILKRNPKENNASYLKMRQSAEQPVLLWMLETGYRENGASDTYEEVMDAVSAVLLDLYREKRALPYVAEMLFMRAKNERNYHDLFWALTRFGDPAALQPLAKRLDANDPAVAALARELLGINAENVRYADYIRWLGENDPFLYFTGESMQFSAKPAVCELDLERKYADKGVTSYEKQPFVPADEEERTRMSEFSSLPRYDRAVLAEHAHSLRLTNPAEWRQFQKRAVEEQVLFAKKEGGAATWYI